MKDVARSAHSGGGNLPNMKEQRQPSNGANARAEVGASLPHLRWREGDQSSPSNKATYEKMLTRTFELLDRGGLSRYVRCLEAYDKDEVGEIACIAVLEPTLVQLNDMAAGDSFFREFHAVQFHLWEEFGSTQWRLLPTLASEQFISSSGSAHPEPRVTAEK